MCDTLYYHYAFQRSNGKGAFNTFAIHIISVFWELKGTEIINAKETLTLARCRNNFFSTKSDFFLALNY